MDSYILFAIVAAAIGFFMIFRKFRFHRENKEIDSSSSVVSPSSSLTPSFVAESSSSHNWTHEVFPSFRGEDVRRDFLSHIQKELQRKGITPFIDNEIKRGESIAPELIQAIRGSKIAIILLSRNYASSKWCLDELVEIMNCRKVFGQTVMAIFYKVDPSNVKKLGGDFGKVFRQTCSGKRKEDIKKWKEALAEVATIAGYHSIDWNNEAAMIERIANDISNKLINSAPSNDLNNLIGMKAHMDNIEPLLHLDSDEVRMIGIWGPSGIGKSTIARFLFCKQSHLFQLCVFMENVKRSYPRPYYDEHSEKLKLQEDFLSQIISQKDVKINHLGVAPYRLKDKRVLVVLDDVDHLLQLEAMAKETRCFGPGSRIIITTQDKKILNQQRINHIYEVGFPPDDEALQIFCMNAFGQSSPDEGFEELAWEATKLSGKLPLGLKVIGSYFRRMSRPDWQMELPRLRTNLDGEIESILMFSYNALFEEDKSLFLYIACFFNNERIEKVEAHLKTKFSNVGRGIQVLAEKSLISIEWEHYIHMHDLLTRLGREIVRKQSIYELEKRQFLLDARDICQILSNNIANRTVIGIDFNQSEIEDELYQSVIVFDRILEFLVELDMSYSKLEKLWEGIKMIPNLKWMNLNGSEYLTELADLSSAINLKKLNLSLCSSLKQLPFSIGNVVKLEILILHNCSSLVKFPTSIGNAINLRELDLIGCSNLKKLPSSIGNALSLEILNLTYCSSLVVLPSFIGNTVNLEKLNLEGCSSLKTLPSSIGNAINLEKLYLRDCSSLEELPFSIGNAISLKELNLYGCSSLVHLPWSIGKATNLEKLNLQDCKSLVGLPSSIGNIVKLKELNMWNCSRLHRIPSSIGNATNLEKLVLSWCSKVVELPSSIGNITNLKILNLWGCSRLREVPNSIGNAINLTELDLRSCSNLVELPASIGNAQNLKSLNLNGCSKLQVLPIDINIRSLRELDLSDCSLLKQFPEISTSIRVLKLNGTAIKVVPSTITSWNRLYDMAMPYCENLKKFPYAFYFIRELHLSNTSIQEISPWIKRMSCVHKLVIKGCTKLVSLPELPPFLAVIDAENCESLETLNCSFRHTKLLSLLNFGNCFKLNKEARDLIMTSNCEKAVLPGDKVPTHFPYRAIGNSLSMTLNGIDTHLQKSLIFKACFLPVYNGKVQVDGKKISVLPYCYPDKRNDINILRLSRVVGGYLNEHLYIFNVEVKMSSSKFIFKFISYDERCEVGECGLSIPSL